MNRPFKLLLSTLLLITILCTISSIAFAADSEYYIGLKDNITAFTNGSKVALQLLDSNTDEEANIKCVWVSSNPLVASVDANGVVSAKTVGTALISCNSANGKDLLGEYEFEVVQAVTDISLSEKEIVLLLGTSDDANAVTSLSATALPENAFYKEIIWETKDESVATVESDGTVHAIGIGKTQIIAKSDDPVYTKEVVCEVTVNQAVESIDVVPSELVFIGSPITLEPVIAPETANNKKLEWESMNPEIASVDANGKVSGIDVGSTTILCKATDGSGVSTQCNINVANKVKGLEMSRSQANAYLGLTFDKAQVKLECSTIPENAYYQDIIWESSDETIAAVDENGLVQAFATGDVDIIAHSTDPDYGKIVTCKVHVLEAVSDITLSEINTTIYTGEKIQLAAEAAPENATNKKLIWESDAPDVASVDTNGNVSGKSVGTATIKCRAADEGGTFSECTVTVIAKVKGLELSDKKVTLLFGVGDEKLQHQLSYQTVPEDAFYQDVSWSSSDESIVSVDENGLVCGINDGTATISAVSADPDYTTPAKCEVTVQQGVMVIGMKADELTYTGEKIQLEAEISPETAANKSVSWESSNQDVAVVDNNGNVTGKTVGTATITCTAADGSETSSSCLVEVRAKVKDVKLTDNNICLAVGNGDNAATRKLEYTVLPEDAYYKNLVWSSSDESIVSVDSDGTVHAHEAGKATVSACSEDESYTKVVSCNVVVEKAVTSIEMDTSELRLEKGSQKQIEVTVLPEDAGNKKLLWESSNEEIATVDAAGNVKAVGTGQTIITGTSTDGTSVSISKPIRVIQAVQKLEANKTKVVIMEGNTKQASVNVFPEDATNKTLNWSSDSSSIAVDSNGLITAVSKGVGTVTCKSTDGSDKSCTIDVVVEPEIPVKLIDVSYGTGLLNANSMRLTFKNECQSTAIKKVVFKLTLKKGILNLDSKSDTFATDVVSIGPGQSYTFQDSIKGVDDAKKGTITIKSVVFADGTEYELPFSIFNTYSFEF